MSQRTEPERIFSVERWRASSDLRTDIARIVVAIAILAGISALDSEVKAKGTPQTPLSVSR